MDRVSYCFTEGRCELYCPERGSGFITQPLRETLEALRWPQLNSGWFATEPGQDTALTASENGVSAEAGHPVVFRADTPQQGNFLVTVTLHHTGGEWLLFSQNRRLAALGRGETGSKSYTFPVNVLDIVPDGSGKRGKRECINVSVLGAALAGVSIEPLRCPTLFIAGDSTVTDQGGSYPYRPELCYCGWGQMLPAMLEGAVAVSNHAHSGLTVETFREEGHWEILHEAIQPGDVVLFQFGHNDQKRPHLGAQTGYRQGLELYIRETKAKGAVPMLISSIGRNTWRGDTGEYNDLLAEYAAVCGEIAASQGIPFLDLHARSVALIKQCGLQNAKACFYPGDFTHTNDFGGMLAASLVAQALRNTALAQYIKEALPEYKPSAQLLAGAENGWLAPPVSRAAVEVDGDKLITRLALLQLAQSTFAYFAANEAGGELLPEAVLAAKQNGYLPPEFSTDPDWLDKAATGAEVTDALVRACTARAPLSIQPVELIDKPVVTTQLASEFAAALEKAANGATARQQGNTLEVKGS